MQLLKKLLILALFLPIPVFGYSVAMNATTTTGTIFIYPAAVNGNNPLVMSPAFFANSTTASSTANNGWNLTGGCFAINGACLTSGSAGVTSVSASYPLSSSGGATPNITTVSTSSLSLTTASFLSSNISQWTNNSGYLTSLSGAASSTLLGDNNTFGGVNKFTNALSDFSGTWQTFSPSHFALAGASAASSTALSDNNTFSGTDTFNNTIVGSVNGNANTATTLQNARNINGVSFNGGAAITINAASSSALGDNNTFGGNTTFNGTVGISTSSPMANLSVVGNLSRPLFVVATSTNAAVASSSEPILMIDQNEHFIYGGGQPTVSACGTSPGINGNDHTMLLTTGSTGVTECTITFAKSWAPYTAPVCTFDEQGITTTVSIIGSSTQTVLKMGLSASLTSAKIGIQCESFQ